MQPNDPNKTDISGDKSELPQDNLPGAPELPSDTNKSSDTLTSESQQNNIPEEKPPVSDQSREAASVSQEASTVDESPASVPVPAGVVDNSPKKRSKKTKLLIAVIAALLVLGGGGVGAYFTLYVPNKPENIWKSAMINSGKVYDEAVTFATKERTDKAMKIEGSYDLDGAIESDGKVNGEWKGFDGKVNGEVSASGIKVGFDVRTIKANDESADLYFKLTGLQGLKSLIGGGNEIGSMLDGVNDQWFVVDHTLFEQLAAGGTEEKFTTKDYRELLQKTNAPTKEYLLSPDPQKAVFFVKEQIGSENKEGRDTYKYKVGYNNENFGKYVEALCNAVKDDKIGKTLLENEKKSCTDLGKEAAKEDTDQTAEVWVDKRTKLPHVVRISDPENSENWIELGQDYQGGDEFPMSIKFKGKEKNQEIEADIKSVVNTKTDALSINGTFSVKGGSSKNISGKVKLKLTQSNDSSVKVDKPENAKSITELMDSLGLDGLLGGGTSTRSPSLRTHLNDEAQQCAALMETSDNSNDESAIPAECSDSL